MRIISWARPYGCPHQVVADHITIADFLTKAHISGAFSLDGDRTCEDSPSRYAELSPVILNIPIKAVLAYAYHRRGASQARGPAQLISVDQALVIADMSIIILTYRPADAIANGEPI
jgi:hypothetical protein